MGQSALQLDGENNYMDFLQRARSFYAEAAAPREAFKTLIDAARGEAPGKNTVIGTHNPDVASNISSSATCLGRFPREFDPSHTLESSVQQVR